MTDVTEHRAAKSRRGQTLLKGHALQAEGHPTVWDERLRYWRCDWKRGVGHCECGAEAPRAGLSIKKVQQWHREHKEALRNA